jgi:hypothetical protein
MFSSMRPGCHTTRHIAGRYSRCNRILRSRAIPDRDAVPCSERVAVPELKLALISFGHVVWARKFDARTDRQSKYHLKWVSTVVGTGVDPVTTRFSGRNSRIGGNPSDVRINPK